MSAFLCSDKHINTIVVWAIQQQLLDASEAVSTAGGLFDCNCAAMEARYVDRATPNASVVEELAEQRARWAGITDYARYANMARIATGPAITAQQAYSLLKCFDYQCSEGTVPETHPVMPWLQHTLTEAKHLSGGKTADGWWGI